TGRRALSARRPAPRVEIHLHLEGSVSLKRLRGFWARPGRDASLPSDPAVLFRHSDFRGFLRNFAHVTRTLTGPGDFALIATDLCGLLRRQKVEAAEVFMSPVIFARRGIPFAEILDAVDEAVRTMQSRGGPRIGWILDGVRQWGPASLEENLRYAQEARGRVLGIGLGGDESSVPAREFRPLFETARAMGLRTVCHAGEFAGPESVWEAVELLGSERIGHGIRACEDAALLSMLRRRRIPLEVCPTSNLRTGVVRRWRDHPLPRLLQAGVRVTLNSDDPALFHTSLDAEFRNLERRLHLTRRELERIRVEGIRASFLPSPIKRALLGQRTAAARREARAELR
ncbi:MAG TPA: adenosine deaminase, partial [Candidatus Polarisedimenticolia bacterium]|nr:adenosine deaminase [Candidatus Polarisedimenticolia bacterium]